MAIDREAVLADNADQFTGIDFVRVVDPCDQTTLRIYLLTNALLLALPFHAGTVDTVVGRPLAPDDIRIEDLSDPNLPPIEVVSITQDADTRQVLFDADVERHYIEITVSRPGDFSLHRLHIEDTNPAIDDENVFSRIDSFFNDHVFSFKAGCPDRQDCLPAAPDCPPDPSVDFPVDYLARDFVSLRNALLEFAAQRYPDWSLPIEADVGVMLAEVQAALGDEFAYIQDRYAREAYLETATERRSVRRKVRLLDFEMHDGRSASALLEFRLKSTATPPAQQIAAGSKVSAVSESLGEIPFEIGLGFVDKPVGAAATEYAVHVDWNAEVHAPFSFDDSQVCLDIGATELFVKGEIASVESLLNEPDGATPPRWTLLRTPSRVHFVRLVSSKLTADPLTLVSGIPQVITRLRWDPRDALPFQMDLMALKVSFNIVPATAGEEKKLYFSRANAETLPTGTHAAVEREGPLRVAGVNRERLLTPAEAEAERQRLERPPIVLFGLTGTETHGIGFVGEALRHTAPEVQVVQNPDVNDVGPVWNWRRSLMDADPTEPVFTLEDGVWTRVRGFQKLGQEFVHQDYATGGGFSVRFGDGEFGDTPPPNVRFLVRYRTAPASRANVPAGSIKVLSAAFDPADFESATNPLAVTNGVDPETAAQAKQLASEAYQTELLFAVRPPDYGKQAQKIPFVQRARGTARWTGSWPTIFVSADPFGSFSLTTEQKIELESFMDCVRQTGRDVVVRDPKTVSIDLRILICLEPNAHASHVLAQLREVLFGPGTNRREKGFFHPDHFSFGVPLRRSALEGAIHSVPGVQAIRRVRVRRRGLGRFREMRELVLKVGHDQILRLENDPNRPEGGTLTINVQGGV